ncbi:hypothetical protein CRG98_018197 [Punica granatum]|uniref:H15 domain-containing protein n=1 Tax=Punica granatum TaxID=22663 RepID=A0A2I0K015_PUNGR|nr:hypothetical protein CRG98_018197 [Punica granatum]
MGSVECTLSSALFWAEEGFPYAPRKSLAKLLPPNASPPADIELKLEKLLKCPTPVHPPYALMIHQAIEELNEEGGSDEKAILNHIKLKYESLPLGHTSFLSCHLKKLSGEGEIGKGPELLKRIKGIRACLSNILKLEPVGEQGYRLLKTLEANSAEGEATTLLSVGGNSSLAMPLVASLPAVKDKEGEIQLGSFVPPPQKKQPNLEGKQWNLETDEEHQELLAQDLNPERVKRHRRLLTRGQHEKFASEANAIQMLTAESLPLINPEQTEHQRRPVTHGQHEQVGIGTNAMPVLTSSPLTNREQRGWYRKPRTHRPRLSLSEATVSTLSSALQIRVVSQDIAQRQLSPLKPLKPAELEELEESEELLTPLRTPTKLSFGGLNSQSYRSKLRPRTSFRQESDKAVRIRAERKAEAHSFRKASKTGNGWWRTVGFQLEASRKATQTKA